MIYREYLETDISDHCNLHCSNCSHHSPYMDRGFYDLRQFEEDVKNLSKVLRVQQFRILGGEPLLNKDLLKYVSILKKYNLADKIGVCTNGTLLHLVDNKFLDQIDFLDISLYSNLPKPIYEHIIKNINRLTSLDEKKITIEKWKYFRKTEILVENKNDKIVRKIWDSCYVKDLAHAIYKGYYVRCTASQNKGKFLKKMGVDNIGYLLIPGKDGLSLKKPNLEKALKKYIESNEPLEACRWCFGVSSKTISHHQTRDNQINIKNQKCLEQSLDFSQKVNNRSRLKKVIKKSIHYNW